MIETKKEKQEAKDEKVNNATCMLCLVNGNGSYCIC